MNVTSVTAQFDVLLRESMLISKLKPSLKLYFFISFPLTLFLTFSLKCLITWYDTYYSSVVSPLLTFLSLSSLI